MDAYDSGSDAPRAPRAAGDPQTPAPPAADASPDASVTASAVTASAGDAAQGPSSASSAEDPAPGPSASASGAAQGSGADPAPGSSSGTAQAPPVPVPAPAAAPSSPEPRSGVAALSPRYQVGAALALAVVAVAVCVHLGMVFLHVAPSNTVTKAHGKAIDDWIYPEFEQNWKLFAPNPLQQNIAVQVRAQIRTPDGSSRTTGWYDLSAQDGRDIDANLVPSHTQQNELRRAWDFFTASHDSDNRPVGLRGTLAESYLRRIVALRLERGGATGDDGVVERVQIRSRSTNVDPPDWSTEKVSSEPVYRVLPWWSLLPGEAEGVKK